MVENKKPSLIVGFIASIGAHALFSFLLFQVEKNHSRELQAQPIEVEIVKAEKTENDKQKFEEKQVVDQNKINEDMDENAKYLSAHNQKVIKETVAQKYGEFQNAKQQQAQKQEQKAEQKPEQKKAIVMKKFIPDRDLFGGYQEIIKKSQNSKNAKNANERNGIESQTRDYLPNTDAGMETLLSTHEFVYYTYYNRIRNQLSQYWESRIREKMMALFKKGRRVASTSDRITKVLIVLDGNGTLIKVQVMSESGISDLDEVAVEAFRLAAPFPHPPKGIVDGDGTIKIRWDFIVET
jgi:protein TonB